MRKILLAGVLAAALGVTGCGRSTVEKQTDGIVLTLQNNPVQKVRLKVISPEIIRVSATASRTFEDTPSLSVIQTKTGFSDWTLNESGDTLVLSTSALKAFVLRSTGEIWFKDQNGNLLLKENQGGGKTMESMTVDGVPGYTLRQVFESPEDEAFYGLGQHQANDMNYKGKNETLFQYNTKVSIPFLVSSKQYGLLWDNYSLTRFGDVREYLPLSSVILYDTEGKEGGLTATYYLDGDPEKIFLQRQESTIDYENLETVENFPSGFRFNGGMIVWEGDIEAKESGTHRFQLYYAGYTKIWVDGELLAEKWRTAWNPSYERFSIDMEPGKKHHIKLEWLPDGGVSYIGLRLLTPVDPVEQGKLSLFSEMGDQIDYYFIHGSDMDQIIKGYRQITGKAQVMPRWAMGFWQSRERYKTQDELLETLKEFRKRKIPIDNIVLDWSYWPEDQWGSHEFDRDRFPDAKAMVEEVHQENAHIMISVWPKFYHNTEHYKEFDANGWMYKQAIQDSIRDWIGRGYIGSFYDAYHPEARKLFWKQMEEHLLPAGFDAWWMDASEPDILSNASVDYRKALMNPTALGPATKYFNAYALVNADAIYNGQRSVLPDQRVFLLTRSGFAGLQRYGAATWSGDIGTRWEDFKAQIPAGLNHSLSGNPYWTMDIGGFCVEKRYERAQEGSADLEEWRELNARWTQYGAFVPLFRSHGQFPFREVFHIAPESHPAYKTMVYYNKLRYRLMPYIYTLAGMVYHEDYTLMRPMVMDFTHDPQVVDLGDQYLFGPSLLVAPVYSYGARNREVYFPVNSGWYNFYNGQYVEGGQTLTVEAPYERMPLYVKSGTILPVGPEIQYTAEKLDAPLTLLVYTGEDGYFSLYEDEGTNYQYEKGAFARIPIRYNDLEKKLEIGKREGSFPGMQESREFQVLFLDKENPRGFDSPFSSGISVEYQGESITITKP